MKKIENIALYFWRWIRALKGFPVVEFDVSEIVDRMGNKFQDHKLLQIFDSEKKDSVAFFEKYISELFKIQEGEWMRFFLGKYKKNHFWVTPWGGCEKEYSEKHLSKEYAKRYVSKMIAVKNSITDKGYQPEKFGSITGQMLINEKGEKKCIIWSGHRRTLSLVSAGCKKIPVEISGGDRWNGTIQKHSVDVKNVCNWVNVRNKLFSKEEALIFFNKYFM